MEVLETDQCDACGVNQPGEILDHWVSLGHISSQLSGFFEQSDLNHLCADCIDDIGKLIRDCLAGGHFSFVEDLTEGVHYYIENGMWVFTELYHYQRGYCCQSGCRHCIYGYDK